MAKPNRHRKIGPTLEPAKHSNYLLIRIDPTQVGTFRFLLEAYGHIGYFSVINKYDALLKMVFSPHMERTCKTVLHDISKSISITILPWPN